MNKSNRKNFYKEFSEHGDLILILAVTISLIGFLNGEYPLNPYPSIIDLITNVLIQVAILLSFFFLGLLARYLLKRWGIDMATRCGIWLGASLGPTWGMIVTQVTKSFVWSYVVGVITALLSFAIGYWFIKLCIKRAKGIQS